MDNRVDFFQKKLSNTRSFTRQRRSSRIRIWIILAVLLLCVWAFLWWKLFWAPANLNKDGWEADEAMLFSLGDTVFLQWEIKADGDIVTHTHTINDVQYWIIGIKSDSINLSDYAWFVELTWIVEKFYQWEPIVKVYNLSWSMVNAQEEDTNIVLDENSWVYILWAGIQFLPSFFDKYVLLNEWENWQILLQNIESWDEISLDYFRCNASDPNRNCKWLVETFANNSAQSFVTSEWDVYYKQSEVQSWFVANGDRWWIFINDVPDDEVYQLKDLMKFANERNMNEWIKSRAMRICQWSWEKLQNITSSDISLKQEWLVVSVSGDWLERQMTCQILVDFSLPTKWVLKSLVLWDDVVVSDSENEVEDEKTDEKFEDAVDEDKQQIISSSKFVLDKSVAQFPVKEEWLVYSSTRWWYSLQFPSSNISYAVSSVKENFGRSDVNCSYVINAIKYSERENLEVSPSIRIYECLWTVSNSWAPEILVYPRADKIFVVQLADSSWWDFANNLKFTALE